MGLFSKEACVFCGTEVGMLKRSKLTASRQIYSSALNMTLITGKQKKVQVRSRT